VLGLGWVYQLFSVADYVGGWSSPELDALMVCRSPLGVRTIRSTLHWFARYCGDYPVVARSIEQLAREVAVRFGQELPDIQMNDGRSVARAPIRASDCSGSGWAARVLPPDELVQVFRHPRSDIGDATSCRHVIPTCVVPAGETSGPEARPGYASVASSSVGQAGHSPPQLGDHATWAITNAMQLHVRQIIHSNTRQDNIPAQF
jgi:hypothetical protein